MSRFLVLKEHILTKKWALGWLTIWPAFYFITTEFLRFLLPSKELYSFYQTPQMMLVGVVTGFVAFGLIWLFINHAYEKASYFSAPTRRMWVIILLFFGLFGIPIYFYRYILGSDADRSTKAEFRWTVSVLVCLIFVMLIIQFYYYNYFKIVAPKILSER